jgi:2-hydroxychromene-2-carboxylate isomerase
MSARPLSFWFEFGSTYSYLSAARIEDLAASASVPVLWEPFLLGPIFAEQGWGDPPFNIYPAKGRYMGPDGRWLAGRCGPYGQTQGDSTGEPSGKSRSFGERAILALGLW